MKWGIGVLALSSVLLTGCPGDGDSTAQGPRVLGAVAVPGVNSSTVFSFDIATVDPATGLYYVTDRNNASIDVVNSANNTLVAQYPGGFAGCRNAAGATVAGCVAPATSTATSGPNGLDLVTGAGGAAQLYVGDANGVVVLNRTTGALIKRVVINGEGPCTAPCAGGPPLLAGASLSLLRADEGCFDAVDGIYAIASPNENPPFVTFIDTANQNVIATMFFQSLGLEACVFDPVTARFYFNNDGSAANPRGEISGVPAAAIVALKPAESATWPGTKLAFPGGGPAGAGLNPNPAGSAIVAGTVSQPLGACDPTGLTLGPGTDIASMCRQGGVGERLTFQIYNKTTLGPANPALAILNIGGGDQIVYDAGTDQYYLGDSRWTATGNSCGGGSAACPLTPVLGIVNGTSRTIVAAVPSGNNSHSVSIIGGKVYSPYTANTATGGGLNFDVATGLNGGIAYFAPR